MSFKTYPRGFWAVFEGIDGCGKSSQLVRVRNLLAAEQTKGIEMTKEPNKERYWGKRIYEDLSKIDGVHARDRFEFQRWFTMDCAENVPQVMSLLEEGKMVLQDRSHFVSNVYGSRHMQEARDYIGKARSILGGDFMWPHLILIFDVSPEIAIERLKKAGRKLDNFEKKLEFLAHVRQMYQLFAEEFLNCVLIDASGPEEEVFVGVRKILNENIGKQKGEL